MWPKPSSGPVIWPSLVVELDKYVRMFWPDSYGMGVMYGARTSEVAEVLRLRVAELTNGMVDCRDVAISCDQRILIPGGEFTLASPTFFQNRALGILSDLIVFKMGFIMEFAENLVLRLMEDPTERDRRFREHLYKLKENGKKAKEYWSLPLRPYGFWTFERHNAQIFWDAQISQVPGRRDPYDDLLQDYTSASSSK
ncbi:Unknown protein [Striga hermonthica]|uniref:Uncharacterized protein n=1 Tax=Striga hermonthica TaxID=68872 RepID=A0A9N7RNY0_STRHE|nr:Unknown protein [Striga hermonthica]